MTTTIYLIVIAVVLFAINLQLFHIRVWMVSMEKKLGLEEEKTKLRIASNAQKENP